MKVTIEINEEHLVDALACAQHGIRYWGVPQTDEADNLLVTELDTGLVFRLDSASLAKGLLTMSVVAPHRFGRLLAGATDRVVGDVLVQCACFGELRYG